MKRILNILTVLLILTCIVGLLFLNFHWGYLSILFLAAITFVFKLVLIEYEKGKELKRGIEEEFFSSRSQRAR